MLKSTSTDLPRRRSYSYFVSFRMALLEMEWLQWHPHPQTGQRLCLAVSDDFLPWLWNVDTDSRMQVLWATTEVRLAGVSVRMGKNYAGSEDGNLGVWDCIASSRPGDVVGYQGHHEVLHPEVVICVSIFYDSPGHLWLRV